MYIKLTRLDNSPIWINAGFVVTVEPRRGGGAIVVPIGDGLDYDVRESPEDVLGMLSGAPLPTVVPVPAPKGLTKAPEDVSPEPEPQSPPAPPAPAVVPDPPAAVEKPARKTTTRARAKSKSEASASDSAEPGAAKATKKPRAPRKPKLPELTLADEQVERLRKMAPGSVRKLQNTLVTQFKVDEPDSVIKALEARQVFSLDRDHVVWVR